MLLASGGEHGDWPDDFEVHDVAEIWRVPPWIAEEAPLHYFERAALRKSVLNEGRAQFIENNRERDE